MKKKSYRLPLTILLIIFILSILVLVTVETVRIVVTKLAVERIAYSTLRYTITNSYFNSLCGEEAILSQAVQTLDNDYGLKSIPSDKPHSKLIEITPQELGALDQADGNVDCVFDQDDFDRQTRLVIIHTMQDTARYYSTLKVAHQDTPDMLDLHRLKITLCSSNRPGFTYDVKTDSCSPCDDVGRFNSGDQVSIKVTYQYGIGSSIGIVVGYVSISAFRTAIGELFR
jgi:hypothetical protein